MSGEKDQNEKQSPVTHKGYVSHEDKSGKVHYKELARQVPHKSGGGHRVYLDASPFDRVIDFFPVEKRMEKMRSESYPKTTKARRRSDRGDDRERT